MVGSVVDDRSARVGIQIPGQLGVVVDNLGHEAASCADHDVAVDVEEGGLGHWSARSIRARRRSALMTWTSTTSSSFAGSVYG